MEDLIQYDLYDITTGQIKKTIRLSAADPVTIMMNLGVGQDFEQNQFGHADTHYYPSGVFTERPKFTDDNSWNTLTITANGVDTAQFGLSLPVGTTFSLISPGVADSIEAIEQDISDGEVSWTTTVHGEYTAIFTLFPYQEYSQPLLVVPIGQTGADFFMFTQTGYDLFQVNPHNEPVDLAEYEQTGYSITDNITYRQVNTLYAFTQTGYSITDHTIYKEQPDVGLFSQRAFDIVVNDSEHTNMELAVFEQTFHEFTIEDGHTLYADTGTYIQIPLPMVDVEGTL